jgi:RNA polymerase sigma-70 factor (ECF subfamily)
VPEPGHEESAVKAQEAEWVSRDVLLGVRERDPDALGRLFDVAFPFVYNIAYRMTGDHHTSEDVAQDVFLKVYRSASRIDVDRHPRPWITTITYNTCRDLARRRKVRAEESVDAKEIGERHRSPGTPEDELAKREREKLVQSALRELDDRSRAIVILHDFGGLSHDEISGIVDISHAAVRKRYSRALKRMGKIIRGSKE